MNYSEVKQLLDAGFSADEIRGFMNNPQNSQNNPQIEKNEQYISDIEKNSENSEVNSSSTAQDTADQDTAKSKNPNIDKIDALTETMNKLIKTIQISNLHNNSVQSTAPDIDKQVDDIMATIIRPEHKGG